MMMMVMIVLAVLTMKMMMAAVIVMTTTIIGPEVILSQDLKNACEDFYLEFILNYSSE